MSHLRRRIYSAVLRLHPAAFRDEFGREMALDFEDAVRDRGFAALLGDAVLSLARQWKESLIAAPEIEQPATGHPFLAGQYAMIRLGGVNAFDLACASVISVLLFFAVGYAANLPNRRAIAELRAVQVNHGGVIDNAASNASGPVSNAGRRGPAADWGFQDTPDYGGATIHPKGPVRLENRSTGLSLRPNVRGGPPATAGTLRGLLWQLSLISGVVWLTSFFLRRSAGIWKRLVLAVLGLLGVAASVAFGAVPQSTMHAQILHATAPLPAFEVATVKPRDPKVMVMMTPPGSENVVRTAGTARFLIAIAYNVPPTSLQLVAGGPEWMDDHNKSYVIEGKIPDDLYAQMQKMTGKERRNQAILMMQSLLTDRFKLKVHFETREMPVYELSIKNGAKLPPPNDPAPGAPVMGGGEQVTKDGLRVRNMTLDGMLTAPWFGLGGRPIVNHTGLTGTYNLMLKDWQPDLPAQGPNGLGQPSEGQASIFTVLEEQLGLKLTASKAPTEVVVIDSIEPPSEN